MLAGCEIQMAFVEEALKINDGALFVIDLQYVILSFSTG